MLLKKSNQLSFSQLGIASQSALFRNGFQIYYSHILHFIEKRLSFLIKWRFPEKISILT